MSVPKLASPNRVFKQAQAFHRSRVPVSAGALRKLDDAARARAFWVSGMARHASVVETHRLIDQAVSEGRTIAEFRDGFTKLLSENGGSVLPPARQNNIFRTNLSLAYAGGRWKQLMDPDILAERPILMYPLGPHDKQTSAICLKLEGFMARHDSPVWDHIAPPNHHQERHNKLLTLTEEDAAKRGVVWQQPEGTGEYPVIDGQQMLPDPGFDHRPHLMASDAGELARQFGEVTKLRAAKTAADYDLVTLAEHDAPIALPELAPADADEAWDTLRSTLGAHDGVDEVIVPDLLGDAVIVNRQSFDAIFGNDPELAPALWDLLTAATEVWLLPAETETGVSAIKRFIGVFENESGDLLYLWADAGPMGWLGQGGVATATEVEGLRQGYLAATRVGRSGGDAK